MTPTRKRLSPLFTWRSAILESELPAPARHVALTLSCHMSEVGDSAFPSLETLARESGRGKSTVSEAVGTLEKSGYLEVTRADEIGRGRVNHYRARVPETSDHETLPPSETVPSPDLPEHDTKGPESEPSSGTVLRPEGKGPESAKKRSSGRSLTRHESDKEHRPRNPVWDGLIDATQRQPATDDERDVWNRAERQIRESLAEDLRGEFEVPDAKSLLGVPVSSPLYIRIRLEVRKRAARYRNDYPHIKFTPRGLSGHWGELGDPVSAPSFEDEALDPVTAAEPSPSPEDRIRTRIAMARSYAARMPGRDLDRPWDPADCPDCGQRLGTYRQAATHPVHELAEAAGA